MNFETGIIFDTAEKIFTVARADFGSQWFGVTIELKRLDGNIFGIGNVFVSNYMAPVSATYNQKRQIMDAVTAEYDQQPIYKFSISKC